MKKLSHKIARKLDRVAIHATFRNRFRQPAQVTVAIAALADGMPSDPIMDGDVKDVSGVLFGLAEIAWDMGWRPRALVANMARLLETYKEPTIEGA